MKIDKRIYSLMLVIMLTLVTIVNVDAKIDTTIITESNLPENAETTVISARIYPAPISSLDEVVFSNNYTTNI